MKNVSLSAACRSGLSGLTTSALRGLSLLVLTGAVVATTATSAIAQSAPSQNAVMNFDVAAGPLGLALVRFGRQSSLQFTVDSEMTNGKQTPGLRGKYTPEDGLRTLLSGTGLTFRFTGPRTVVVEKLPETGDARVLGPLRIEGAQNVAGVNGINGSTDPTATEGTRSYTSGALSIASKTPQSIKDTPQSVSVLTQQRMQDQNITDLTSAMDQATGITLVNNGSYLNTQFVSRGFYVDKIQIDGGAPLSLRFGYMPQIDMAQYDHVEVLRGADGLFNGYGAPSGTINVVRKRPLDHAQVAVEGQMGSWDNYRTTIDATSPLGFDGRLRGRAVISYQEQEYFYDTASNNKTLVYGILEADLAAATTVSAGFSLTRQNTVPWFGGLPRYEDGGDLGLPIDTSLALPWSTWGFETKELFAKLDHRFNDDWGLKINLTRIDQVSDAKYGAVVRGVNPVTGLGPILAGGMDEYGGLQNLADVAVDGKFDLFGHSQQIVFGANWQETDGGGKYAYAELYPYPYIDVDIPSFDPSDPAYREPPNGERAYYYRANGQKQWGFYANIQLTLWEPLHLITGLRYGNYKYEQDYDQLCISLYVTYEMCDTPGEVMDTTVSRYQDHDVALPASVSLVYDVRESLTAYASYTDIYQSQARFLGPDRRPLDPVTGSNVEAGIKYAGSDGKLNASVAIYRIEQADLAIRDTGYDFEPLPNGVYCCYKNGNQINLSYGLDAEVTGELTPGWQISAGYTYNVNEYKGEDSGSLIGESLNTYTPRHLLKLWTSYEFQGGEWLQRLSVGGGINAQTASYTNGYRCAAYLTDSNGVPTADCDYENSYLPFEFTQGFYAVLSARASYELDDHWQASLNVNNLLDKKYYETAGTVDIGNWYGDPRNFMLSIRGTF